MKRMALIGRLLFDFRGRISRAMLWWGKLMLFVYYFLVGIPLYALDHYPLAQKIVVVLFYFSCVWSYIVLNIKRLHDRNLPGWWLLVALIPVLGFIYCSVQIIFMPGNAGRNRYGLPPKSLKAWWGSKLLD